MKATSKMYWMIKQSRSASGKVTACHVCIPGKPDIDLSNYCRSVREDRHEAGRLIHAATNGSRHGKEAWCEWMKHHKEWPLEMVDEVWQGFTTPPKSEPGTHPAPTSSIDLLEAARAIQAQRAKDYDQPGGERSMLATVQAFNTITRRSGDRALTESEGWLILQTLKDVRDRSTAKPHRDSLEDGIAYSSLKAEARLKEV